MSEPGQGRRVQPERNIVDLEGEGQGLVETEASVEDPSYSQEQSQEPAAPQDNPFWGELADKLGPNLYEVAKPYLSKADTAHREGIEKLNSRFEPYKGFIDQGVSPDMLNQSLALARQLDQSPETVYEQLGEFLRQNGRLPSPKELEKQIEEDPNAEAEDPRDAQLRQLMEQQNQLQQFIQASQQAALEQQAAAEADSWRDQQVEELKKQGFDDSDIKEVFRFALAQVNAGQEPDLAKAAQHYTELQNRIRTAPRPGASAPRVPGGAGGGTPNLGQNDPSKMSKEQRQALVAQMLQR